MSNSILLEDTPFLSPIMRDYFAQAENIKAFYNTHPDEKNWENAIQACLDHYQYSRKDLKQVLEEQYQKNKIAIEAKVQRNLDLLLKENTLTVCTGHQLNLFTGPLFSILKVIQAICLAEELQNKYPKFHFVPIYWMATEDHDWEEINHFYCFDKKITWDKKNERQAVGKISLSDFKDFEEEIKKNLSEKDFTNPIVKKIISFYRESENLTEANQKIFNYFFNEKGLLIIDGDHPKFKEVLRADITAELKEEGILKNIENANFPYPFQANPRKINLFYFQNQKRERIEKKEDHFILLPSEKEIENIEKDTQNFSPNVLLRTVYQQRLLPNLCYIGGHAEMSYWLQMKPHFDAIHVFFPILIPRITALIVKEKDIQKLNTWGISLLHFLQNSAHLERELSQKELAKNIQFSYTAADEKINEISEQIKAELQKIDPTLIPRLEAEKTKFISQIDHLYDKMQKAQKQKLDVQLNQLQKIIAYILPNKHLREREMNILELILNHPETNIIEKMMQEMKPLGFKELFLNRR